jgi:tRNA threonylcarbamoyladenosine biosynthesis protein TsaB
VNLLAFDCAVSGASAAVLRDGGLRAERVHEGARGQAERLVPLLEEALAAAGLGYADLDALAVTVGPGSFTGIRVGLATARGLMLATGLPCAAATTLEVLAAAAGPPAPGEAVTAAVDSRRGDLFVQAFGADLVPLCDAVGEPPEAAARRLARLGARLVLVGDAAGALAAALAGAGVAASRPDVPEVPRAAALARLCAGRAASRDPPAPVYLRPPDAVPAAPLRPPR